MGTAPLAGHPQPLEQLCAPHGLCGQCQALQLCRKCRSCKDVRPSMDSLGEREHLPPGRVLAWPLSVLCPHAMSVSSSSGQPGGRAAGRSRGSLPAGRGWRQLHHRGSLQPPCGCSLSAQAQTSLKLIPPQSLGLLGLLSSGHRSSSAVQIVLFPRAVAFCEVLPCGSARLPVVGSSAALEWRRDSSGENLEPLSVTKGDPRELERDFG